MVLSQAVFSLSAQQGGEAVIVYAEGETFSIVSEGRKRSYTVGRDDVIGMSLKAGDVVLTDDGSFLELNLKPGDGVVKIAENTTFTIDELDASGGGGAVLRVNYGRIRVRISSLFQGSRLWVSGHDTVAGVRGTDFGYDLFYDRATRGAERQTAVYCFDGKVDVYQFDRDTVSKIDLMEQEPFVLEASRMVTTISADPEQKLKSRAVDGSILEYWELHPFLSAPGTTIAPAAGKSPMILISTGRLIPRRADSKQAEKSCLPRVSA